MPVEEKTLRNAVKTASSPLQIDDMAEFPLHPFSQQDRSLLAASMRVITTRPSQPTSRPLACEAIHTRGAVDKTPQNARCEPSSLVFALSSLFFYSGQGRPDPPRFRLVGSRAMAVAVFRITPLPDLRTTRDRALLWWNACDLSTISSAGLVGS